MKIYKAVSMLKVTAIPFGLPLKHPFHIAHGSSEYRENVFLQIIHDDKTAYGEAAVVPYYGVSKEQILEDLQRSITAEMIVHRETLSVVNRFAYSMSACAYTSAMQALEPYFPQPRPTPPHRGSSYTIAYQPDMQRMLESIQTCGFSTIKLKAGFADDIQRIRTIREHFPDLKIRLDANQGWNYEQAYAYILELKEFNIELIEEPIKGSVGQIQRLSELSEIPILLDETVQTIQDLRTYAPAVSGIVVKLAKSGGPQAARVLIEEAKNLGLESMLSCMIESSLGIAHALTLEPLCKWIDLDAPTLLSDDVFSGLTYQDELPTCSLSSLVPTDRLGEAFASAKPFIEE
ncbi:MAG: enolase C-terminal domain-like protein [Sphaerochaeta sp.]|jgi:o-succinylbenzoate synthase|uniref:enolase C-terminal domain-like protein n=1 Tax=Sphaerochaeta sp. TaxID=1972642 RepID=UPI002A37142E|nr:enolase C-terminal domain-like protein [Sphaerochaeta sp.]MDX9823573.1 enolase C-terminal domain-like protein [Sphaerochaeta sp.]